MATVLPVFDDGDRVLYEVESMAWGTRRVRTFDERIEVPLTSETIIDVILLGDGFTETDQSRFETFLSDWFEEVFAIWPFSEFKGAFRVRGVFTPSPRRVDAGGDGYFGVRVVNNTVDGFDRNDVTFRTKVFDLLQFVADNGGLNLRQYPDGLAIGLSGDDPRKPGRITTAHDPDVYHGLYRNCVVCLGVLRTNGTTRPGGSFQPTTSPPGHALGDEVRVGLALAADYHHEFGHAFALLLDEYISRRASFSLQQEPSHRSVFDLWNIAHTRVGRQLPWHHLSWDGLLGRDPDSYVAQMWIGGEGSEKGVCHAEYKCLMNGQRSNYYHRTDEQPSDLVPGAPEFAWLRDTTRLCLWCEEIVTIKIMEKTDAMLRFDDVLDSRGDINQLGKLWFRRWVEELRSTYWQEFELAKRITERERDYANLTIPQLGGVTLATSNLMQPVLRRKPSAVQFGALFT